MAQTQGSLLGRHWEEGENLERKTAVNQGSKFMQYQCLNYTKSRTYALTAARCKTDRRLFTRTCDKSHAESTPSTSTPSESEIEKQPTFKTKLMNVVSAFLLLNSEQMLISVS